MTKRFKRWAIWRRQNRNGLIYQLLVLLRITPSPSFEMYYGDWLKGEKEDGRHNQPTDGD